MNLPIPPRFEALAAEYPELSPGRIILQEKGQYRLWSDAGEQSAVVSGRFHYEAVTPSDYPAVGDYVMADIREETAVIHHVLPRRSVFLRRAAGTGRTEQVVAANVDTLFLCMSLNLDFNLRRLERYLSLAWDSGAVPVVVLTKADLCSDRAGKLAAAESVAMGTDILLVSALEEDGCRAVLDYIKPGQTIAFVGSSGAGKSTLINRLLGEERLETRDIRSGDDKGRHTTTHRQLLLLPNNAMVIDTPGMRELGLWDATAGVEQTFADIEELTGRCRFGNCSHKGEPGCAVCAALERGELDAGRWQSYRKLKSENEYAADSGGYLAAKEKKFKEIAKINKRNKKK